MSHFKTYGGSGFEIIKDMQVSPDGDVFLTGGYQNTWATESSISNALGDGDAFLAKYNSSGDLVWVKSGGSTFSEPNVISEFGTTSVYSENNKSIYSAGTFQSLATFGHEKINSLGETDVFITNYSTNGELMWIKHLGGIGNDQVNDMSIDRSGNIYLVGSFEDNLVYDGINISSITSGSAGFVIQLKSNGEFGWLTSFRGKSINSIDKVLIERDAILINGYFSRELIIGKETLKTKHLSNEFLARLSLDGVVDWTTQLTSSEYIDIKDFSTTGTNIIFTGGFSGELQTPFRTEVSLGGVDIIAGSVDISNGEINQLIYSGSEKNETGVFIEFVDGQIVIGGQFEYKFTFMANEIMGDNDIFLGLLTSNWDMVDARSFGGPNLDIIQSAFAIGNRVYVSGDFFGEIYANNESFFSSGQTDFFISSWEIPERPIPAKSEEFIVYPNPSNGLFNLEVSLNQFNEEELSQMIIYSISGRKIHEEILPNTNPISLNLTHLSSGTYLIQLKTKSHEFSQKLIIHKDVSIRN
ncbi:MAG: T9SS type A sorting domain-containing protein [Marinoscillum sp.]